MSGGFAPCFAAQNGTSPHRIISIVRTPSRSVTTGASCVGATLKRGFHHWFFCDGRIEHGLEILDQAVLARHRVAAAHG